ncbi:MAG: aldehyde dehydrogenase (NADP(+)) [Planctomycetota bacterium]|nr:aldehyde dehydrogenase (NADP(+)) [Planctomycetota bacterium]
MSVRPVLIRGEWMPSTDVKTFHAVNPTTTEPLADEFPVSPWAEVESAIEAASAAAVTLRGANRELFATFLESYAAQIEARADALVETAHLETALAISPRLRDVELPRTTWQLRQAAAAARDGSWAVATIDTAAKIRSIYEPLGPVVVIGPNNFPFAFNSVAGGDFAAAVASGNPVIAKAHPSHPLTTTLLAEAALEAVLEAGLPPAFVQVIYRTSREDGLRLVRHPKIGGTGFTGSRTAGMALKEAADRVGKPIYLEMSSINPVVVLPGALEERRDSLADEFTSSCLMGSGQFCTNPGLVLLPAGKRGDAFVAAVKKRFEAAPVGTMLAEGVRKGFLDALEIIRKAGGTLVTGGEGGGGKGFCVRNTLLTVSGKQFVENPHAFQTEVFGNGSVFVLAEGLDEMLTVVERLEGNLTGCIYSDTKGSDDAAYDRLAPALRTKVGRLINDKMPTGVAVSPAMNHGGPFPATGHPGFTAVGIPASIHRFARLACYDNVRSHRLPALLRDENPTGVWRLIDKQWTRESIKS